MQIIERFITNNENYKARRTLTMKGIMIHSVGCPQPDPEVFVKIFNDSSGKPNGRQVGVHAFVGHDGRVFQTMPWDFQAWHCGKGANGSANSTHIGIELTEPKTIKYIKGSTFQDNDPVASKAFVEAAYKVAVELFAHLCKQYNFNPLADGVIISHAEGHRRGIASNHGDVEHLWKVYGITMDKFRQDIKAVMDGASLANPRESTKLDSHNINSKIVQFNLLGRRVDISGTIIDGKTFAHVRPLVEGLGFDIGMKDGIIEVRERNKK